MAVKALFSPLDILSPDEQAAAKALFDASTTAEEETVPEQGWFIDNLTHALSTPFKALPLLATGFVNLVKSRYSHVYVERSNEGGNFCGHDPDAPQFVIRNHPYFVPQSIDDLGDKRRSQILYDIDERIKAYYYDSDVIPSLQQANSKKRTSYRKRNSSRREAIVNLLCVMILNMDLSSLRVGQPRKGGGFFNYSLKWLARKAKLSFSRAKRAMSDLNSSMIISSYQYRELINKEKKEYIAHNASRVFDMEFFKMLEIDEQKLGQARDYSYKKQKKAAKNPKMSPKEQAVFNLNMKKVMKELDPNDKSLKAAHTAQNEDEKHKATRLARKRNEAFFALLEERPELKENSEALDQAIIERFTELNLLA